MTPAEALAKLGPPEAVLTGFAPYLAGYARMGGVVLYYKHKGPKTAP